ncbi:alpha-aminoadipic semialdehyde synthase, mitochondrial-like [Dysidea avara]
MLTSSYVTPEMMKLQQQIKDAGIMVFNEIGFDPGIDHMLTKQCIDDVHEKGGKVLSYMSWSAGLPVPEAANVPLKYKFSWSPPTVMLQPLSSASWLQDGKVITVPEGRVMYHPQHLDLSHIIPEVEFEGIVNPSIKYIDFYNIPEVHSLVRGSIRYKGFSATMCSLQQIGLITDEQHRKLQPGSPPITWQDLLADLMQTSVSTLKDVVFKRIDYDSHSLKEIEAMGLLSTEKVPQMGSPSQSLAKHLTGILSYKPGEQDVAIIYNVIDVEWPDKSKERKTVTFVDYGDIGGFTAMDKTVGFPTGIAAKMILEGRIPRKGIVLPVTKDIYEPILEELKTYVKPAAVLSTAL